MDVHMKCNGNRLYPPKETLCALYSDCGPLNLFKNDIFI